MPSPHLQKSSFNVPLPRQEKSSTPLFEQPKPTENRIASPSPAKSQKAQTFFAAQPILIQPWNHPQGSRTSPSVHPTHLQGHWNVIHHHDRQLPSKPKIWP